MHIAIKKVDIGSAGSEVLLYTFGTDNGMEVSITNYGGIITSIKVPDRQGVAEEITMGFDSVEQYLKPHPYFGALVGRYANRIGKSQFVIGNSHYNLSQNSGRNHLHGGNLGFDKKVWMPYVEQERDSIRLTLSYLSPDGEEGYPGNLLVNATYRIFNSNEIRIDYIALSDRPTHVNLTSHGYFNLNGFRGDVLNHLLQIDANHYLPLDRELIVTGEIRELSGSPFDFRVPKAIGTDIDLVDGGYDNCFLLNEPTLDQPSILLHDPLSGRQMEIYTTQPGVQLYTSNFLDGTLTGHSGIVYKKHWALCLEAQHLPDTPNKPQFPSTLLKPGNEYRQTTRMVFGVKK